MVRILALLGLAAALAAPQASFAQATQPSGYGTTGPFGEPLPAAQATSSYARFYNANNEALYRAEQTSEWIRTHGAGRAPGY